MLAVLTLTTPLLLGGLTLLALPLIAHWLHRRSRRTIVFPSIALLVETVAQQSQFHRLKRWLLLALRLLAVACIVLAFTRPVWESSDAGAAVGDDAAVAVVLVVDVSASTGQESGGVVELTSLQATASAVLDDLEPGLDVAGVVLANGSPRAVFSKLSANVAGLRSEIARLSPTFERADIAGAFVVAGKLLAEHEGARRLVVVSDLQRSNWSDVLGDSSLSDALPAGTVVSVVPSPEGVTPNVGLSRPRHFPALPLAGEPFDVTVHVSNGSKSTRQVRVTCERTVGDGSGIVLGRDEQTVTLTANEHRDVSFRIPEMDAERQIVRLEAKVDDGFPVDDVAWLVVETSARTPVVVLSDDDPSEPGSSAYYLLRALAPSEETSTRFAPRHAPSSALSRELIDTAPMIVVGYLGALTGEQAQLLTEFVREGGGLVLFSGEGPVGRSLQALEEASEGGFLPWQPGPRLTSRGEREARHLTGGRWRSRWLRAFDEQSQLVLQQIPFDKTWAAGAVSPAGEVLLTFDDGRPALGVRSVERGMVVLANFSPESTTSDLARHGAFVAFTQMLVQASVPEVTRERRPVVGQAWMWRSRFAESALSELSVVGADDEPIGLASQQEADQLVLLIPPMKEPGLYQLLRRGVVLEAVAVGLDERESDLTRIASTDIEARLGVTGGVVTADGSSDGTVLELRGRPLWGEFFAAALVAIGLELFLLGWWRR